MINITIKDVPLEFETSENVFSPDKIDRGTLAMLTQVEFKETDKVLDLGCGYGVVGILASKLIGEKNVILCDIQDEAVQVARRNTVLNEVPKLKVVKSDGLNQIRDNNFTLILSNTPYHVDFSVAKNFIEMGFTKLVVGGKMVLVTKRKEWYKNKFISVFGGAQIAEVDGYYVFTAEKRAPHSPKKQKTAAPTMSKKLMRKQTKKTTR